MTIESHVRDTYHFFVMKSVCAICLVGLSLATQASAVFTPDDVMELRLTVNACLNEGDKSGNCPSVSRKPDGNGVPYGPIENWDVSRVTSMRNVFRGKTNFNKDLSRWDVSQVTDMAYMFYDAQAFNQDLSLWDVSRVTSMRQMFYRAYNFNQVLCGGAWSDSDADQIAMSHTPDGVIGEFPVCCETGKSFSQNCPSKLIDGVVSKFASETATALVSASPEIVSDAWNDAQMGCESP